LSSASIGGETVGAAATRSQTERAGWASVGLAAAGLASGWVVAETLGRWISSIDVAAGHIAGTKSISAGVALGISGGRIELLALEKARVVHGKRTSAEEESREDEATHF